MSDTRTGPLVHKLVDALKDDISEVVGYLQKGREQMRLLEGETKGVNGMSAFLKSKGNELDKMIGDLTEEAEGAEKKMLGSPIVITTNVDKAHVERIAKAKGKLDAEEA